MLGQVKQSESLHIRLWQENVRALRALKKGPESRSSLSKMANGLLFTLLYGKERRSQK